MFGASDARFVADHEWVTSHFLAGTAAFLEAQALPDPVTSGH